jgi:hypothetical protein
MDDALKPEGARHCRSKLTNLHTLKNINTTKDAKTSWLQMEHMYMNASYDERYRAQSLNFGYRYEYIQSMLQKNIT